MSTKNLYYYLLPNKTTKDLTIPLTQIAIGSIIKYVLGGYFLDLFGHLLIFIGCVNVVYFLTRGKEINYIVLLILLGAIFLGTQMILIHIFLNIFNIHPIF